MVPCKRNTNHSLKLQGTHPKKLSFDLFEVGYKTN